MIESPFFKLACERRSIRRFLDRPVERGKLLGCLESAQAAPSACNAQPWKFIVVDDPGTRKRLAGAAFSGIYSINAHAARAPVLAAVVSQKGKLTAWFGNRIQDTDFHLVDIGIACEHFILQAHELGLGTCWLGWFNAKKAAKVLCVPEGHKIEMLISVGYPAKIPDARPRKPLEEMSSFNRY